MPMHDMVDTGIKVNEGELFDEVNHTQGGQPHILQFLWDEYVRFLSREIKKRKKAKQKTVELPHALKNTPATAFLAWATNYLKKNRVAEQFYVDENFGLRLTNLKSFVICPGIAIRGTMQDSGAVEVTHGRSQPGNDGVVKKDISFRI